MHFCIFLRWVCLRSFLCFGFLCRSHALCTFDSSLVFVSLFSMLNSKLLKTFTAYTLLLLGKGCRVSSLVLYERGTIIMLDPQFFVGMHSCSCIFSFNLISCLFMLFHFRSYLIILVYLSLLILGCSRSSLWFCVFGS